jgi:hypothetical protein
VVLRHFYILDIHQVIMVSPQIPLVAQILPLSNLVLVHVESVLGLVQDALVGTLAVDVVVLAAAGLVLDLLAGGLLAVWNDATGKGLAYVEGGQIFLRLPGDLVTSVGDVFLELLLGGLGGIGSHVLLGLCEEC